MQCSGVMFSSSTCCRLPEQFCMSLGSCTSFPVHTNCISETDPRMLGSLRAVAPATLLLTNHISPAKPAHPSCTPPDLFSVCARALLQDGCPKQQTADCCLAQWTVVTRRRVVRLVLPRGRKIHHLIAIGTI